MKKPIHIFHFKSLFFILFSLLTFSEAYGHHWSDTLMVLNNRCYGTVGLYQRDQPMDTSTESIKAATIEALKQAPGRCANMTGKTALGFSCKESTTLPLSVYENQAINVQVECSYSEANVKKKLAELKEIEKKKLAELKEIEKQKITLNTIHNKFYDCAKKDDQREKDKHQDEVKDKWFSSLSNFYFEINFKDYVSVQGDCFKPTPNEELTLTSINNSIKSCTDALKKCEGSDPLSAGKSSKSVEIDNTSREKKKAVAPMQTIPKKSNGVKTE
jgi:hypothetical protein